jgi:phage tail-like protein
MTNDQLGPRVYAAAHFALELHGIDQDLGLFRSIEGGGLKCDVMTYQNGGTYDRWRQLAKPKFDNIKLQLGMGMSEPFYKWIEEFFSGKGSRKNGAIVAADFYYKERARREFTEAMIAELTFPALSGSDKNSTYMNVSLAVEDILFKKGDGNELKMNKGIGTQKDWKANNFTFNIDGFTEACARVTKVESFTVKQNIIEYASGGRRTVAKVPSAIDFPQISFSMPEADAQPLLDHFRKRGVDGEVPGRLHGQIDTYDNQDPAQRKSSFRIEFFNADIVNAQPDKSDSTAEEIKLVKFDLYVERMSFAYLGGSGSGALEKDPSQVEG